MTREYAPRAHQEPMHAHLRSADRVAVYSGCGSGKTVVVLTEIMESLFDRMDSERWAIVAPKSVAEDTWQREAAKWRHLEFIKPRLLTAEDLGMRRQRIKEGDKERMAGLEFESKRDTKKLLRSYREPVHVMDYGTWRWVATACGVNLPYDGVVFDESGFLRDYDSERFRASKKAVWSTHQVRKVIELDGTPNPVSYENLIAPLYLLDKGQRLGTSKTEFRNRFSEPDPDSIGYGGKVYGWRVKSDKLADLQRRIGELAVSTDRDIGVELVESDQEIVLPPKARKLYDEMEQDMMVTIGSTDILAANAAVMASKLVQICNGFIFDESREVHTIHTAKLDAITEAIEGMQGRPVLLPYLFVPEAQMLAKRFGNRLRFANDKGAKDQFRAGDLPILAFHPESMSHGIDGLQGASNTVFWFGATYRWDWAHQVAKRLHRDGQQEGTVFVRMFIAKNTIERRIIDEVLTPRGQQVNGLLKALKKGRP